MRTALCTAGVVCAAAVGLITGCGPGTDGQDTGEVTEGSGGAGPAQAGGSRNTGGSGGTHAQVDGGGGAAGRGSGGAGGGGGVGGASAGGAGGSASTGGAAGSGGAPVVLPCDQLSAVDQWQQLLPDPSISMVVSVAVDPRASGTVYLGGVKGTQASGFSGAGLWTSTDCGASWKLASTGKNAAEVNSGSQWHVAITPISHKLFATSGYGGNGFYVSTNGGTDFDDITPTAAGVPHFVQDFSIDPADENHVVVSFHDNCTGQFGPQCMAETTDGAASWRILKGPAGGWAEGGGPITLGSKKWLYAGPFDGLFLTQDGGATWSKRLDSAYPKFASDGTTLYIPTNNGLYVSQNGVDFVNIALSPKCASVGLGGDYLYASFGNDFSGTPIYRALRTDLTKFANLATPHMYQGTDTFAYDADHHVLYTANYLGGGWRTRTQ